MVLRTGRRAAPRRTVALKMAGLARRRYHTVVNKIDSKERCPWCLGSEAYIAYHDKEWGTPLHEERALFELLILEGAQAGLSWSTILNKRGNYRKAFDNFDARRIGRYDDTKLAALLADAGIVRNRLNRGFYHLLCLHAGDRHGQRPPGRVLPPRASAGTAVTGSNLALAQVRQGKT